MFQVIALWETLELQDSAKHKGHFALYNCLVLGHTKYKGVQRVYCNPFPGKKFHGSHRLDLVMIRPTGIDNGGFVVSPDTVWYARVLLLFTASAATDTGSKSFDCALVSTLESYADPENGHYIHYTYYMIYIHYTFYTYYFNIIMIIPFKAIMAIILIMTYQVGLDRLVLRFYMSLTTGSLFSTSSPSNIS